MLHPSGKNFGHGVADIQGIPWDKNVTEIASWVGAADIDQD